MNKHYLDLLTKATQEVFETMSFLEVVATTPIEENVEIPGIDITAVICLAGEISGMLGIHCSRSFAEHTFDLITGGGMEARNADLCDTVGELANMIAGTLKRMMSTHFDLFDLSLPSVSLSNGQRLFYTGAKGDFPRLLVPFLLSDTDKFYVELLYHKR